mmetsp:Transcript_31729/g.67497  ORF Transcript_31729/g.67497 Transcript_31729/m.67497 type:complete len:206 (-) Transcript_31729:142-759(-)
MPAHVDGRPTSPQTVASGRWRELHGSANTRPPKSLTASLPGSKSGHSDARSYASYRSGELGSAIGDGYSGYSRSSGSSYIDSGADAVVHPPIGAEVTDEHFPLSHRADHSVWKRGGAAQQPIGVAGPKPGLAGSGPPMERRPFPETSAQAVGWYASPRQGGGGAQRWDRSKPDTVITGFALNYRNYALAHPFDATEPPFRKGFRT